MKLSTLLIGALLLSQLSFAQSSSKSKTVPPKDTLIWLAGEWKGIGYQVDGATWDIVLSKDSASGKVTISYPTLGCSGSWNFVSSGCGQAVYQENIAEGVGTCDQGAIVTISRIKEGYINIAYFLPGTPEKLIAYSVLRKL